MESFRKILILLSFLLMAYSLIDEHFNEEKIEEIIQNHKTRKENILKNKWKKDQEELNSFIKEERERLEKIKDQFYRNEISYKEYHKEVDDFQIQLDQRINSLKKKILVDQEEIKENFGENQDIIF